MGFMERKGRKKKGGGISKFLSQDIVKTHSQDHHIPQANKRADIVQVIRNDGTTPLLLLYYYSISFGNGMSSTVYPGQFFYVFELLHYNILSRSFTCFMKIISTIFINSKNSIYLHTPFGHIHPLLPPIALHRSIHTVP